MFNSLITSIAAILIAIPALADQKSKINAIYQDFKKTKQAFFQSDLTKENYKVKLAEVLKRLDAQYEQVKTIEAEGAGDILLSREGNQMAYDLELFAPLKDLAKSGLSKEACGEADHDNKLNQTIEGEVKTVEAILNKLCKN